MTKKSLNILVADDEQDLRNYIIHVLETQTSQPVIIQEAEDGQQAVNQCQKTEFDLIFLDVKMPNMTGLEVLSEIKSVEHNAHIIMVTAHGNVRDAVEAIKDGAYDYLEKPLQADQILKIVEQAVAAKTLVEEIALSRPILESDTDSEIIGQSKSMKNVFSLIQKLAQVDSTVLLRGENGTGKELVAKAIHFNSPRKKFPFVAVNCAAIPEELVESELFGHEKGAFTGAHQRKIGKFQLANRGTLFLDEVGELKPEIQVKLLRALQDQTFIPLGSNRLQKTDARIIAATNQNLEKMMIEGTFREDLFFRLNVMPIFIPPLRERKEDIPYLVDHFISHFTKPEENVQITDDALLAFSKYEWPGNIRQLENIIQRALLLKQGNLISIECLPQEILQNQDLDGDNMDFEKFKEQSEKEFIVKALKANKGKINKTVANANIPKNTLLRKIKKFAIDVKQFIDAKEE